jgi:Tol biopolymer transport system component
LTLDPSLNQVRVWSPDGKKIAFTSNRTPFNRVFERNAYGSGQEIQVVDLDVRRQVNAWDWSRDGKYVLLRNENEVWYYSPSENKSRTYIQEQWPVRNAQILARRQICCLYHEREWQVGGVRLPVSQCDQQVEGLPQRWGRTALES